MVLCKSRGYVPLIVEPLFTQFDTCIENDIVLRTKKFGSGDGNLKRTFGSFFFLCCQFVIGLMLHLAIYNKLGHCDHSIREVLAMSIAPLAPTVLIVVTPALLTGSWPFHYELPLLVTVSSLFSYFAFFSAGLPVICALRRWGKLNKANLVLAGAALGGVAGVLFVLGLPLLLGSPLTGHGKSIATWLLPAPWGAGLGFSVAVTYGVIAGWPNNSCKPKPLRGSA